MLRKIVSFKRRDCLSPGRRASVTFRTSAAVCATAVGVLLIHAAPAQAATDRPNSISELLFQLRDPWTWFGLGANALFFMRFAVQWIVSERRKRSTVPVAFWYLSLAGASCLFIYGCHLRNLVVMLAGLLPCAIYIRNLMLIHGHTERLRRAGLPTDEVPVRAEQDLPT